MKKILLIILAILLMATAINYFTGTTITLNGKQVTDAGQYVAAYIGLILLAAVLVIVIPSVFMLVGVFFIVFAIFFMLFFPLVPIVLLLLPTIVFVGIGFLIYKLVKKKK